jgi:hypothetical protein
MADFEPDIPVGTPDPQDAPRGTAGDFAKTLGAGTLDIGSNLAAGARYAFEAGQSPHGAAISKALQDVFSTGSEEIRDTLNPETKKLAAATLTSPEFWEHPLLATSLKATGMVPAVAALAIPGGILADTVGATLAVAGGGAALNAGAGIDEFYKKLDAASDDELQEQSPKYRAMREVMDEKSARARFNRESLGWAPAINAVLGAAAGAVGPAGTAARGLARGVDNAVVGAGERGALGSAAVGGAEGAVGNAAQAAGADVTGQQADINAGFAKEMDLARAANSALEGGALGGLMGGAVGLVAGGGKTPAAEPTKRLNAKLDKVDEVAPVATSDATPPQTKSTGTTGVAAPPPETIQVGNPQNAPTRSSRDGAKKTKGKVAGASEAEVTTVVGPDAAQAAAVAANEGSTDQAPPVAAPPAPPPPAGPSRSPTVDILARQQAAREAPTVPEAPATLDAQAAQLQDGQRAVMMVPKGSKAPAFDQGKNIPPRIQFNGDTYFYDPSKVNVAKIIRAAKGGKQNELLGLGPVDKATAVARAQQGETPVAVTERAPDGTELKAAAGTDQTAPVQAAALEAQKAPGSTVQVERPEQVLQMRQAAQEPPRTGRVLRDLRSVDETQQLGTDMGEAREPTGKNRTVKEKEEIKQRVDKAQQIIDANVPNAELEAEHMRKPDARDAVIRRARGMVEEAEKQGVKIPARLKTSIKGDAAGEAPAIQVLRAAKDLVKIADKRKQGREITEAAGRFAQDEQLIRAGHSEEVLARRREEGDEKLKRKPTVGEEGIQVAAEPETTSLDEKATQEGKADAEKNAVKTSVQKSAKGAVRGVDAPEEERVVRNRAGQEETVSTAKAANAGRTLSAEEKAAIAERMGLKPAKVKNDNAPKSDALVVDRNPTEAQKAAGNYKKGHRRVEGLEFTIENPRGAIRRGPDWETRMPADYGYLRRTKGADGDHVDAYDGRSGDKFFIVDQLDHRTGEFDEHKVMMRFKSEEDAVKTYHAAFSDGHGPDRMGHIHEVTPSELKEWLNEGDQQEPHLSHVLGEDHTLAFDREGFPRREITAGNGQEIKPLRSSTAAEELKKLDFSNAAGVHAPIANFMKTRLSRLAGDTTVHFVNDADMAKLMPSAPHASGLHVRNKNTGHSEIYIRQNGVVKGGDEQIGSMGHILLHELTHAATVREIERVPNARNTINKLSQIVSDYFEHNQAELDLDYGKALNYGFSNEKEFIAEAFSNPIFQRALSRIELTPDMKEYLGFNRRQPMTAWDMLRKFVQKVVSKITGEIPNMPSVLDGILRVGEHLTSIHEVDHPDSHNVTFTRPAKHVQQEALDLTTMARDRVKEMLEHRDLRSPERAPIALRLRTFDNIAQIADHFYEKAKNPVRTIHEAIEATRVTAQKLFEKSEPLVRKLAALRSRNSEQFDEFSSLLHDATVANVHPDVPLSDAKNAHLGKDALKGVWSKSQHPDLARRYNALSPELKEVWHEVVAHYSAIQNKMSLGIIENQVLKLLGIEDKSLAGRIHAGSLTDADKSLLGGNLETIENASELSKIEGPYVPLMRRGDHVVKADYMIDTPASAKKISSNEFEFGTRKEAESYVKNSPLQSSIKKVWVDEKTGELNVTDPATGKPHKMSANDLDSVDRYRVTVQNRHVEFVQGRRAAEARAAELAADSSLRVHKVVPRSFEPNARQGAELSTALSNLVAKLERSDAYKQSTPTQQAALRQAVNEAALASHGSTRISSRSLPRRGVKGFSEDLVQNAVDYGWSSSKYLAKLEHAPDLEAGLKEMKAQLDRDHSKTGQYARTSISNEVRQRVEGDNGFDQGGKFSPIVKRAMSISFMDKLASPAYSVINAMQPGMVTMPYLSGRYGVTRSFTALARAYNDISALKIFGQGFKETAKRLKGGYQPDDFISAAKSKLSADEQRMIDEHLRVGTIDPSAGLEIQRLVQDTKGVGGKIDATLGYLEGVTREMPRAVEAVNRMVTALAAYRLERSRGANHETATAFSKDAVNSTQFNYSPTNSPALFNHPLLKVALQFKKYGQGMYQLIGSQVANAVRNESPGARAQAVKTLITLAATHTAMAGALGLPTEPFKYLLMGAHAFGLTKLSWADIEDKIRKEAANVLGHTGGELATRGLPRLFNIDLSRVGLDSVTSFGEPKSSKEADVKSWLFDSVAGPVVSLGADWIKGLNQLTNGDFERAAENLIPMKAASDSLRAYRQATEGKKTAAGRQTMTAYSAWETGLRVAGFGSGREAEIGAANSAFYRASQMQKDERSELVNAWAQAKPTDKMKAMAAITKWNQGKADDEKIKPKELTAKLKRDEKANAQATHGLVAGKRDKRILQEGAIYNTR